MLMIPHLVHLDKVWIRMLVAVRELQIVEIDYLWVPNFLEKCKSPSLSLTQKYEKYVTFSPRINNHRDFQNIKNPTYFWLCF